MKEISTNLRIMKSYSEWFMLIYIRKYRVPEWLSRLSDFGSGHDLVVHGFGPRVGLCVPCWALEPASDFVSPSLCPFPAHALSASLSKINTH